MMETRKVLVILPNGDSTYGIVFTNQEDKRMVQTPFAQHPVEEHHMESIREMNRMKL